MILVPNLGGLEITLFTELVGLARIITSFLQCFDFNYIAPNNFHGGREG